jgi:2-polyprenyl-3-methyl-5-hydroxy-6-metoxy-1,4-benzoquinol methylase
MAKKIFFESGIHQLMSAAARYTSNLALKDPVSAGRVRQWVEKLEIQNLGQRRMQVSWTEILPGSRIVCLDEARFYTRGDAQKYIQGEQSLADLHLLDPAMKDNISFFDSEFLETLRASGLNETQQMQTDSGKESQRHTVEELFHDQWAADSDPASIQVVSMNEAATAPEMRYISEQLGDLSGRLLLDIGCGLGEAAVYFAMKGASVIATDLSSGMCRSVERLGEINGVRVKAYPCALESLDQLPVDLEFDIIYCANTLHHVDIVESMDRIKARLKRGGTFVSWDPVAYNPIINIYRKIATEVRTVDEHPLTLSDISYVRSCFHSSSVKWFWLTTLLIFVCMAVVERRNPNRERYWKKVVEESKKWEWLYKPLEWIDNLLLRIPFLRPLCWNVVIIAKNHGA